MAAKSKSNQNGSEMMETFANAGSDAVKQSMDKAMKGLDEFTSFGKGNVEAFIQCANAYSKGMEAISAEVMSFSKQSLEDAMAATKAALGSRSVQEFVEINSDYAKSAFDSYVGRVNKLGDMATTAAKDTFEPLNTRFNAFVEIVQSSRGA
jgi:phasin family protein